MNSSVVSLYLAFVSVVTFAPALAGERNDCRPDTYSEVRSLAKLPDEIRTILKTASRGLVELSDRGEDFNIGDVGAGPRRRFILAAVGPGRAFVAIEHGGRGYFIEYWAFKFERGAWHGAEGSFAGKPAESFVEFIDKFCRNAGVAAD